MTKTLKATLGSDEANVGTRQYKVRPDDTIEVADGDAETLIDGGGFVEIGEPVPAPPRGLIVLAHPDGGSCSFDGVHYPPDENGNVTVPVNAELPLRDHGFHPVRILGETEA